MFLNLRLPNLAYAIVIIIGVGYLASIGSGFILPLLYGALFAVVLSPMEKRLRKKLKKRALSIPATYLIVFIPIAVLVSVVSIQISNIINTLPSLGTNLQTTLDRFLKGINRSIPFFKQNDIKFTEETLQALVDGPLKVLSDGLLSSPAILLSISLSLLYSIFFLMYSKSFRSFLIFQFDKSSRPGIKETLSKIRETIQAYIAGVGKVMVILSVLNSLGLWIIGVDYALFWGILAGILSIIPYIGTVIGGLLPLLYSLSTSDHSWQPAAVAVYYFVIQQIEGNIITPKVVGKQVDLNPLFSIISLLFFASLWGVGGIILALPIMSILRIIFEQFEETESIAVLMSSDLMDDAYKFKEIAEDHQHIKQ